MLFNLLFCMIIKVSNSHVLLNVIPEIKISHELINETFVTYQELCLRSYKQF